MSIPFDPRQPPVMEKVREHVPADTPLDQDERVAAIRTLTELARRFGCRSVFHWLLSVAAELGERL